MNSLSKSGILIRLLFILVLFILAGCAVNPVTGKKQISLMSEQQELALGAEADPQIVAQFGLYENQAIQTFINKHGQDMAKVSHRPDLKFTFRVLDSPVVNAFAVPGGYVYFTRGILAHFNNEAEFAGVLGHEIGHITARHSAEQYTKSTLANVFLIGGLIVSKELRAFASEAQSAMQLLFLKYSRDNESQSDELGVEYSTKVGYDAREMADFFKTLKALGDDGGSEIPTFLSTHPDPGDRSKKVSEHAIEWQAKTPQTSYKINRDSYLKMIDGIVYGEDPQQGYVDAGVFYHPELKFQYPVPSNWKLANSPAQVQMAPSEGKALMILTLAEGSDLNTAATNTSAQLKLTVTGSRNVTVNGLQAIEVMSEQVSQDPNTGQQSAIRVQSAYIKYSNRIYVFHGVSTPALFGTYDPHFDRTMYGFKALTDQSKINVSPARVKVVSVKSAGTLAQALSSHGVATTRHKEISVLNGMDPKDRVETGTLIKIVTK